MGNRDLGQDCPRTGEHTGVGTMPLAGAALHAVGRPERNDRSGRVPTTLSDLPTVAVKMDVDLDRTLPMEPVVLAQLCAQTQISERRRVLPSNLEYSVHVLQPADALAQPAGLAASARGTAPARGSRLQGLALLLGPVLGIILGASAAWQLRGRILRSHWLPTAPTLQAPNPRSGPTAETAALQLASRSAARSASVPAAAPEHAVTSPVAATPQAASPQAVTSVVAAAAAATVPSPRAEPAVADSGREARPAVPLLVAPAAAPSAGTSGTRKGNAQAVRPIEKPRLLAPLPEMEERVSGLKPIVPTRAAAEQVESAVKELVSGARPAVQPLLGQPVPLMPAAPPEPQTAPDQRRTAHVGTTAGPPLVYLSGDKPQLPPLVRRLYGHEAVVGTYRLCVHPSGVVTTVTAVVGIPFDDELQKTLRGWRFAPRATSAGAACIDQELHFEVDE